MTASANGRYTPPKKRPGTWLGEGKERRLRPPPVQHGMPRGSVNAWLCPKCRGLTVAIHVDTGGTPMFLACRADGTETFACDGRGESQGYPPDPPPSVVDAIRWEWYRPDDEEWLGLPGQVQEHVNRGGLLLRALTHQVGT